MLLRGTLGTVECGHPSRKYLAAGKCGPCYFKSWAKKNKVDIKLYGWARNMRHRFGVGVDFYFKLLKKQHNKCALCGSKTPRRKGTKHFLMDHKHGTKKIRGLLCHQCNRVLGIFKDNPTLFDKAAKYLRRKT